MKQSRFSEEQIIGILREQETGHCQGKMHRSRNRVVRPLPYPTGMPKKARPKAPPDPFRWFDSSPEVIRLVVMMYVKFPLSLRNVEDLLHERGIDLCHETVRLWWRRFGPMFANEIRKKRVEAMRQHTHWRWHLDEVYVKINGEMRYLWRAVDHEGEVLESFVTKERDKAAALKFIKKAIRRHGRPEGHRHRRAALLRSRPEGDRWNRAPARNAAARWLNNRAENSHQPFRRRERAMLRFRRMKTLQTFALVHGTVHNHFNSGASPRQPQNLQGETGRRTGCPAHSRGINLRGFGCAAPDRRQVRFGLTAPTRPIPGCPLAAGSAPARGSRSARPPSSR